MAIAPRLDLRQCQTLVMTPQLRQAIKLLQFSNVEVAAFVEEELERNPLLERDEVDRRADRGARGAGPDRATADAASMPTRSRRRMPTRCRPMARHRSIPTMPTPTTPAGWPTVPASLGRIDGRGGDPEFETDDRGIDDLADGAPPAARTSRGAAPADLRRPGGPDDRRSPDRLALPCRPADRRTGRDRGGDGAAAGTGRSGARAHDAVRSARTVRAQT